MKRILLLAVVFTCTVLAYGRGTQEKDYEHVNGLENWSHQFDLEKVKPGQYNLLIRSTDVAGNTAFAGPYNIFYDPASALPIVGIANPVAWMKVSSTLNIVGTCSASNGVDKVELQVDSGDWKTVSGKDFWSYYLSVDELQDGPHQVTVRGYDKNGLLGPAVTVSFNLDKFKPVVAVTSHQIGDLVAGEFDLAGKVSSASGIASLRISTDGTKTFSTLGLNGDEKATTKTFIYHFKSKDFQDGPLIVWFEAKDRLGTEMRQAFLLFVDNTPPKIEVISPTKTQGVSGIVRFVGKVTKFLGVTSFDVRVGEGKPQPITVIPGNPYWTADVDLSSIKDKEAKVTFEAVDHSKNHSLLTLPVKMDFESALPVLTLDPPLEKGNFTAPVFVSGTLLDSAGPKSIAYSINGGTEAVVDVAASFRFTLDKLVSGVNKITLTPINVNGLKGHSVTQTFNAILGAPKVSFSQFKAGTEQVDFEPGLTIAPEKKGHILGEISMDNPLKEATWTLGSLKAVKLNLPGTGKSANFDIPLPDDPPFGIVPLVIQVQDSFGQSVSARTFLNITDYSIPRGGDELSFPDSRIGSGSSVVVTPDTPLSGYFGGGTIKSAVLTAAAVTTTPGTSRAAKPPTIADALQVAYDGSNITIKANGDGRFDGAKLKVTNDKGRVYEMLLGTIISDLSSPEVKISTPLAGTWAKDTIKVTGEVRDTNALATLEVSTDAGAHWQVVTAPSGKGGAFQSDVALTGSDGPIGILIRATDVAGRSTVGGTAVRKDSKAPEIEISSPKTGDFVQGTILIAGRVRDDGRLTRVETNVGGKPLSLNSEGEFSFSFDTGSLSGSSIKVRAVDASGNEGSQDVSLNLDASTVKANANPSIEILFPPVDAKGLSGKFPIVGRVKNFSSTATVTLKKGNLSPEPLELTDGGFFQAQFDSSVGKENVYLFSAQNGPKERADASYRVPFDEQTLVPNAQFIGNEKTLQGNVFLLGSLSSRAVGWSWQVDSGEKKTFATDSGKLAPGAFFLDLGTPSPGAHKVILVPVDSTGKEGKPAQVDFVEMVQPGPVEFTSFPVGAALTLANNTTIKGRIASLNSWKKLEIRFADATSADAWNGTFQALSSQKTPDGFWNFESNIPVTLPFGRIAVVVRGEDSGGQKVEGRTFFHRVWPKKAEDVNNSEGIYFDDTRISTDGKVEIAAKQTLEGLFVGRDIKKAFLTPATPKVDVQVKDKHLVLSPLEDGLWGPFTIHVQTVDDQTFDGPTFTFASTLAGPILQWDSPSTGEWVKDKITVKGTLSAAVGLGPAEVSLDGGSTWQPLPVKKGVFQSDYTLKSTDGGLRLQLRAADAAGHLTLDEHYVIKDAIAPEFQILTPPEGEIIKGVTTISGTVKDIGKATMVEFSDDGKTFKPADGVGVFAFNLDFATYKKIPEKFLLRTTDAAGNQATTPLTFQINEELDKPEVQIQTPAPDEVVRSDFVISGMVFDDKGVKSISWRLDGGSWKVLDGANSFRIPIVLNSLTDNAHTIEMQAENITGIKGNIAKSQFMVSLNEPASLLFKPEIDKTVKGIVGLEGAGLDKNGIKAVYISMDNGLTWNKADFKKKEELLPTSINSLVKGFAPNERQEWILKFDTKTLKDGTYAVLVRTLDSYDTVGLYTTLINIDNTPPDLAITAPNDGQPFLDTLKIEGRVLDNLNLVSMKMQLRPIDSPQSTKTPAPAVLEQSLPLTRTFSQEFKVDNLTSGWYNLRLEAQDAAGNMTWLARNIRVESAVAIDRVELLYPEAGEAVSGNFSVEGRVVSRTHVDKALIQVDGKTVQVTDLDSRGYFQAALDGSLVSDGEHQIQVKAEISSTVTLSSDSHLTIFQKEGPWLRIKSHKSGSFVTQRPFIEGDSGWSIAPLPDAATQKEKEERAHFVEDHQPVFIDVSLDNGKTFKPAQGNVSWKYRLESLDIPNGPLPMIFRAHFRDGSTAVRRLLVTVDQTPPQVTLLVPQENGHYTGILKLSGWANDNYGVTSVDATLRTGDKGSYELPSFIQGLYLDNQVWGATWWETAAGLTFFDDNVKLQGHFGMAPDLRFGGMVTGAKLIANVAKIPFSFFLGPDWNWYSMSFGVGANFSYFSMSQNQVITSNGVFLGSVLVQWEIAKLTLSDLTMFKTYSWYAEFTEWFISSDVEATAVPTLSTGIRIGIF